MPKRAWAFRYVSQWLKSYGGPLRNGKRRPFLVLYIHLPLYSKKHAFVGIILPAILYSSRGNEGLYVL